LAKVRVLRGDVTQFDDVMAAMTAVKPDRVINLAYYIRDREREGTASAVF
jgi:dTDP-4-dehydrorhamnose reductase